MAVSTDDPLLSIRGLRVGFRTEQGVVQAVDGVSLDLSRGEILGIVGESGSGKSLTWLSVMGLIRNPNVQREGEVLLRGRSLLDLPERAQRRIRGREMAMIFQDPMTALTPVYTIGWQIVEQIRAHTDLSARAARARAVELLGEVGIPDARGAFGRFPHQLSGGTRQRAVIAMALSCNPALLIADEPTTALDVTVQAQILDLLRRLRADFGSAIVLITHDLGVVAELADRVAVMYAGRIVEAAPTRALFDDAWHPYTWGLLDSIPPLTGIRPRRLPSIPGAPPALLALPAGCAFAPRCACRMPACDERPETTAHGGHEVRCFVPSDRREALRRVPLRGLVP